MGKERLNYVADCGVEIDIFCDICDEEGVDKMFVEEFDKEFIFLLLDRMRREMSAQEGKNLASEYLKIPKTNQDDFYNECMRLGEKYPMMYSVIERSYKRREKGQEEKLAQASRMMRGGDFESAINLLKNE